MVADWLVARLARMSTLAAPSIYGARDGVLVFGRVLLLDQLLYTR